MPKLSELITESATPKRRKLSEVQADTRGDFGAGVAHGFRSVGVARGQDMEQALGADATESPLAAVAQMNPMISPFRSAYRAFLGPDERATVRGSINAYGQDDAQRFQAGAGASTSGKVGNVVGAVLGNPVPTGKIASIGQALRSGSILGASAGVSQPVEGDYTTERAGQVAKGATIGAAVNGGLYGIGRVAERLLPQNFTATLMNMAGGKANRTPFAAEGEALAARTGVPLSPGAVSGSKAQTMAENAARQSIVSRDLAFEADKRVAQRVVDYIGTVGQKMGPAQDAATVGQRVEQVVRGEVNRLAQRRDVIGAKLYREVDQLAQGRPFFEPKALKAELENVYKANKGVIAADAEKVSGWAYKQLRALKEGTGLAKLIQNRRFWSAASAGKGNLFENASPGMERRIAAQMLSAIDKDLDDAARVLGGTHIGAKLQQANTTWRKYQQAIEGVEASPLGKVMGEEFSAAAFAPSGTFSSVAPERWVARIKQLEPSQASMVRTFIEKKDPQAWGVLKRRFLEDALEAGQNAAPSEGANVVAIRGNAFINALAKSPKDQARLRAIYSPRELREMQDAFEVIRRWGDKTGYNFSGTAGQAEAQGLFNTMRDLSVRGAANTAGAVFGTRAIARLMSEQGGRRALLQLKRLPPQTAQAQQLIAYLSAIAAGQGSPDEPAGAEATQ